MGQQAKDIGFIFARTNNIVSNGAATYRSLDWYRSNYPTNNSYILYSETYEYVYPAIYDQAEQRWFYKWQDDSLKYGERTTEDTIMGRVVNIKTGELLTVFALQIRYNEETNTYYLADLYDGDVSATRALTEAERSGAIEQAISHLKSISASGFTEENVDWDHVRNGAVVEHLENSVYYSNYLTPALDGYITASNIGAGRSSTVVSDLYIVDLPITGYGSINVIFAPEREYLFGFEGPREQDGSIKLDVAAIEKWMPYATGDNVPFSHLGQILDLDKNGLYRYQDEDELE